MADQKTGEPAKPAEAAVPPAVPAAPAAQTEPVAPPSVPSANDANTIIVTARPRSTPGDPFEELNLKSFTVIQTVDKAFTGPAARTYKRSLPSPVRSGLRNALSNLQEPVIFLNFLIQLKPGKSAETFGRFVVNSTIGGAGLFDVAKKRPFNLPHRTNGFAYSLGYYGVKPGPFLYLPLIGPTTLRDVAGRLVDLSVLPFAVGKPFSELAFAIPTTVIRLLDERAEADEDIQKLRAESKSPYSTVRENYLRKRQAEIDELRGRHHDAPDSSTMIPPRIDLSPLPDLGAAAPGAASSSVPGQSAAPRAILPDETILHDSPEPAHSDQAPGSAMQPQVTPDQPAPQ